MAKDLQDQVFIYSLDTSNFYTDNEDYLHKRLMKSYVLKKRIRDLIKQTSNQERIKTLKNRSKVVNELSKSFKEKLMECLSNFDSMREVREDAMKQSNVIGLFSSSLTRTLKMQKNKLSEDLIVVRAFYYDILNNLITDGFYHKGEKYIYFSSSAGQIRTKKTVFIKEQLWERYEGALTCGLSTDEINAKGGCNVNKLLAYKALTASASQDWRGFEIDRTIVVPDLETPVTAMFDYIDRETYEITPKEMTVGIEHTDGCGMVSPRLSKKSFMVRLPYVKGLLVPFDFERFSKESGNTKVTDIYGKEWDIVEDKIDVIFTASQFKMKKYYEDWQDYKKRFKDNDCRAVRLNMEEIGEDANLNYQMLQTLTDLTKEELIKLSERSLHEIEMLHNDSETMLRVLGATKSNRNKTPFQEALMMYPELLNDNYAKSVLKAKRDSLVKQARAGKLRIDGKYTYLIPDLYAFCERLFLGKENPEGLLNNGDVYCSIFKEQKVDVLRSPHLYKEHAIRNNVKNDKLKEWFITKGIYTSIHDPISRILQFDNDGDKALVVQDQTLINAAERNMRDVLPLYYEMGTAESEQVSNKKIYDSLLMAFRVNIGEVSNNITKVLNRENPDMNVVKWLTAENNFMIDYAKTLYMPERPMWVDSKIKQALHGKVPHFFRYAKDKEVENVEPKNTSPVNMLESIITKKRFEIQEVVGTFDYTLLMQNPVTYSNRDIVSSYKVLNKNKRFFLASEETSSMYALQFIRDSLLGVVKDQYRVTDVLVDYIYTCTKAKNMTTMWDSFGWEMVYNLKTNLKGTKRCSVCGDRFKPKSHKNLYCGQECFLKNKRLRDRNRLKSIKNRQ